MKVTIFRLGHRIFRDKRLSTHVFLTARALGAKSGFYSGEKDSGLESSVNSISKNWGGSFEVKHSTSNIIKKWKQKKGQVLHLTMYGIPFEKKLNEIKKSKNLLVVVGGEKVPPEVYQQADWNISVSLQPQSEVGALGILMYELSGRKIKKITGGKSIVPQERGKKVNETF